MMHRQVSQSTYPWSSAIFICHFEAGSENAVERSDGAKNGRGPGLAGSLALPAAAPTIRFSGILQ